jgi:hypothetical protein
VYGIASRQQNLIRWRHSSVDRQRAIADQISKDANKSLGKTKRSGTQRARGRRKK